LTDFKCRPEGLSLRAIPLWNDAMACWMVLTKVT